MKQTKKVQPFVVGVDAISFHASYKLQEAKMKEEFHLNVLGFCLKFLPRSENFFKIWLVCTNFQQIFFERSFQSLGDVAVETKKIIREIVDRTPHEDFKIGSPQPYKKEIFIDFWSEFNLLESETNLRHLEKLLYESACEIFYPRVKAGKKNNNHSFFYLNKQVNHILREGKTERFHGFTSTLQSDNHNFLRVKVYNKSFEMATKNGTKSRKKDTKVTVLQPKAPSLEQLLKQPMQQIRIEFSFLSYFYKKYAFKTRDREFVAYDEALLTLSILKVFHKKVSQSNFRKIKLLSIVNNIFERIIETDTNNYGSTFAHTFRNELRYRLQQQLKDLEVKDKNKVLREQPPIPFVFHHLLDLFAFSTWVEEAVYKEFKK